MDETNEWVVVFNRAVVAYPYDLTAITDLWCECTQTAIKDENELFELWNFVYGDMPQCDTVLSKRISSLFQF